MYYLNIICQLFKLYASELSKLPDLEGKIMFLNPSIDCITDQSQVLLLLNSQILQYNNHSSKYRYSAILYMDRLISQVLQCTVYYGSVFKDKYCVRRLPLKSVQKLEQEGSPVSSVLQLLHLPRPCSFSTEIIYGLIIKLNYVFFSFKMSSF